MTLALQIFSLLESQDLRDFRLLRPDSANQWKSTTGHQQWCGLEAFLNFGVAKRKSWVYMNE